MIDLLTILLNLQSFLYLIATIIGAILFILVFWFNPDYLSYVLGFLAISYCPLVFKILKKN